MMIERVQWDRVADPKRFQAMVGQLLLALGTPASVRSNSPWAGPDDGYDARVDDLAKVLADAGVLDIAPPEMKLAEGPVMVQATVQKTKLVEKIRRDVAKASKAGCRTLAVFLHHQPKESVLQQLVALGHENGNDLTVIPFPPDTITMLLAYAPWVSQQFLGPSAGSVLLPINRGLDLQPRDFVLPFIGRDDALATLDTSLQRLTQAGGGIFVLSGPSGIGKTRLLVEWAQRAGPAWNGHSLVACVDRFGIEHLATNQALSRTKAPVVVIETEPCGDDKRFHDMLQPLLDAIRMQRLKLTLVLVVRQAQVESYTRHLRAQKLWSEGNILSLAPWSADVVQGMLSTRLFGPQEVALRKFIGGNPGLGTMVARMLRDRSHFQHDDTWTQMGAIVQNDAKAALDAAGMKLPEPFFLATFALAMPIDRPVGTQVVSHPALESLFSMAPGVLDSILHVLANAGLLRDRYQYRFSPELLGVELITEVLDGPRCGEFLARLTSAKWFDDPSVLQNLATAITSPDSPGAQPLRRWFQTQEKPSSLYAVPDVDLLFQLARAVPKDALAYIDRLLNWFPATDDTWRRIRGNRSDATISGLKAHVSGDELYPLLSGIVAANPHYMADAMRILADARLGPGRYSNRTPTALLGLWLDPHNTSVQAINHAFSEVEAWCQAATPSIGQCALFDALVRVIMRPEVVSTVLDDMQINEYHSASPPGSTWLEQRDRAILLVETGLRHPSPQMRHIAVGLLYDLGEAPNSRLEPNQTLVEHTENARKRLFDVIAELVKNETSFSVLAEIQRVAFWRWLTREGSPTQVAILRAMPTDLAFMLYGTTLDQRAVVAFGGFFDALNRYTVGNDRYSAWLKLADVGIETIVGRLIRDYPTPETFSALAHTLNDAGLDDATMSNKPVPMWLWKLARTNLPYLESIRLDARFEGLPAWLRDTIDDQWLQVSDQALNTILQTARTADPATLTRAQVQRTLKALRYRGLVLGGETEVEMLSRFATHPDEDVRALVADAMIKWLLPALDTTQDDDGDDVHAPPSRQSRLITSMFVRLLVTETSLDIQSRLQRWLIDSIETNISYRRRLLRHVHGRTLGDALATRFAATGALGDVEMRLLEWCANGDLITWLDWIGQSKTLYAIRHYFHYLPFGSSIQTADDLDIVVDRADLWQSEGRITAESRTAWLFQLGAQVANVAAEWVRTAISGEPSRRLRAAEVLAGVSERTADADDCWTMLFESEGVAPNPEIVGLFEWTFGDIRSLEYRGNDAPPIFEQRRARLEKLAAKNGHAPAVGQLLAVTIERLTRNFEEWKRSRALR